MSCRIPRTLRSPNQGEGNDETVAKERYDMGKQSKLDLTPRVEDVLTPIAAKS